MKDGIKLKNNSWEKSNHREEMRKQRIRFLVLLLLSNIVWVLFFPKSDEKSIVTQQALYLEKDSILIKIKAESLVSEKSLQKQAISILDSKGKLIVRKSYLWPQAKSENNYSQTLQEKHYRLEIKATEFQSVLKKKNLKIIPFHLDSKIIKTGKSSRKEPYEIKI